MSGTKLGGRQKATVLFCIWEATVLLHVSESLKTLFCPRVRMVFCSTRARALQRLPRHTFGTTVAPCFANYHTDFFSKFLDWYWHYQLCQHEMMTPCQSEKILAINLTSLGLRWISSVRDRVGTSNLWSIKCTPGLRRHLSACTVRTSLPEVQRGV